LTLAYENKIIERDGVNNVNASHFLFGDVLKFFAARMFIIPNS
jgi:hypothetical protein